MFKQFSKSREHAHAPSVVVLKDNCPFWFLVVSLHARLVSCLIPAVNVGKRDKIVK